MCLQVSFGISDQLHMIHILGLAFKRLYHAHFHRSRYFLVSSAVLGQRVIPHDLIVFMSVISRRINALNLFTT